MLKMYNINLKSIILFFTWIEYLWELYLGIRQYKKVSVSTKVPLELKGTMSEETFSKARLYTLAKQRFGFVKDAFSVIVSTIVIFFDILAIVWNYSDKINYFHDEISTSCIWLCLLSTASTIIDLPFTIYNTFILEENFGFNKQTTGFFIWDKIKAFILGQVLTTLICSVIIYTVKNGGNYFFVWLWLIVGIISFILLTIYPMVIAPLFDKFTPLPDGELRERIEVLAGNMKFPLTQLYVVEGSKRSTHSNAYFYGLFNSKRIVLFDTLLAKDDGSGCTDDEILAVLCHELGHWKFNHLVKNLIIMQVNLLMLFAGFGFMLEYKPLYEAVGFHNSQPVLVGLLVLLQYVMTPYNTVLSFLMTCLSRKFEFEADAFVKTMDKSEYLIHALIQLNKDNLGFPIYDYIYSIYHYSHPPLLERIDALKTAVNKND